jgi:hypothetical protein
MQRSLPVIGVAILAVGQAVLGLPRGLYWVRRGTNLIGWDFFTFRVLGLLASAIGGLVIVTALLYVALAVGILAAKRWAQPLGFVVIGLNVILALSGTIKGESLVEAMAGMIIPAIILWYLLSPAENPTPKGSP